MTIIGVNAGHTIIGKGTGAVGFINESIHTRYVANELLKLLGDKGVNLTIDKSSNYLAEVCKKANLYECDLFVSIHFNAGKGHGVEAFTWKGEKIPEALNICKNISSLGFKNRGVKDGSELYVIKHTKMKAILVEVCFIDTLSDIKLYNEIGYKKIALAIYNAIV